MLNNQYQFFSFQLLILLMVYFILLIHMRLHEDIYIVLFNDDSYLNDFYFNHLKNVFSLQYIAIESLVRNFLEHTPNSSLFSYIFPLLNFSFILELIFMI